LVAESHPPPVWVELFPQVKDAARLKIRFYYYVDSFYRLAQSEREGGHTSVQTRHEEGGDDEEKGE
jgi:hypothetical protein